MKKKTVTSVGDSAHAAATAVGENARDLATDLRDDLANLAEDAVRVATEYLAPKARDLADYVTPRVRDAAGKAADYVQPRAADLGRRASEARDVWQPKLVDFANETRDNLQPKIQQFARDTRENLQPYLDDARDRIQPAIGDAYARVQPLVDAGRDRVNSDLMPHINEMVDHVTALPETQEAKDRLVAARAALAGELKLPEPEPKRSVFGTIVKLVLVGGLIAGVVFAVKKFLAPEDSGWQAHEPSEPYRPQPVEDTEADAAVATDVTDDAASADGAAERDAPPYGDGSYVGENPSEEFTIKGNERSMKYHVPGYGGYDRTIADVWFSSEDAAQAAGFTKAQR